MARLFIKSNLEFVPNPGITGNTQKHLISISNFRRIQTPMCKDLLWLNSSQIGLADNLYLAV